MQNSQKRIELQQAELPRASARGPKSRHKNIGDLSPTMRGMQATRDILCLIVRMYRGNGDTVLSIRPACGGALENRVVLFQPSHRRYGLRRTIYTLPLTLLLTLNKSRIENPALARPFSQFTISPLFRTSVW